MVFALNHLCRRLQVGRSAQHMKNGWQVLCWVFSFEPGARIDSKEQVYLGLPSYGVLRAFAEWSNCPDYGVRHGRLSRLVSQDVLGVFRFLDRLAQVCHATSRRRSSGCSGRGSRGCTCDCVSTAFAYGCPYVCPYLPVLSVRFRRQDRPD